MVLNLANVDGSDIKWELIKFPDGHKHLNLTTHAANLVNASALTIKIRIKTYDDVFILAQAVSVIRAYNADLPISLYVTYLLASRYDREMHDHDSFDLKLVCQTINGFNFRRVTLVEPHSNVATSLIDRCVATHPLDQVLKETLADYSDDEVCFVVPDLGAVKRVEAFLGSLKRNISVIYSNKHRVITTGEITGIDVFNPDLLKKHVIIYDDLCDGGRTFTELAKVLRATGIVEYIELFVAHGLFSKGLLVLVNQNAEGSYVDKLYTTNSFKEQDCEQSKTTGQLIITKVI